MGNDAAIMAKLFQCERMDWWWGRPDKAAECFVEFKGNLGWDLIAGIWPLAIASRIDLHALCK